MASLTFEGGINEQDLTQVSDVECIDGYNFELGLINTHYNPRKPFDLLGTATNAQPINGFAQLIKNDDTETTLVQAGGTVYEWNGTSTFTSRGTVSSASRLRGVTWELGGYSVVVDTAKSTVVKKWDGTSFTTLTTGLSPATLYAKYALVHLNRVWLFNITTTSNTPHMVLVSAFEDPESYSAANRAKGSGVTANLAFFMLTPDLKPINGAVLFYNTIIISTEKGRLWKLTGSDATDFAWEPFYAGSSAIGTETIANIGDDLVYMRKDGVIESLRSTETFGDVKTDDLSKWISTTVAGSTDCITVYDQSRQKVYFFIGSNKVPVLYKEMLGARDSSGRQLSPWSKYKTAHASSFSMNAAIYMRQPGGDNYYVYWGDSVGRIFQMEGTSAGDPGTTSIEVYRKSKLFENLEDVHGNPIDPNRDDIKGRVYYRRVADVDLLLDFEWSDDYSTNRCTVPLKGPGTGDTASYFNASAYFGGEFYFNTGFLLSQRISSQGFSPVGKGPGFYVSTTVQTTQDFDILKLEI